MKTFRVSIFEEMGGYSTIQAKNEKEAKKKAKKILDMNGFNDSSVELTHRDVKIFEATEVKIN